MNIIEDHIKLLVLEDIHQKFKKLILNEAGVSTYRRTKSVKRNTLAGRSAVNICKEQNPALYRKYKKFRDLFIKHKRLIMQRYGAMGQLHARSSMK